MAANLARHRNNVICLDLVGFIFDDMTVDANQNITINWSKFDQYVQMFIDAGAGQYLKLYGQMCKQDVCRLLAPQYVNGIKWNLFLDPDSDVANYYLDQIFPMLKTHLEYKTQQDGWPAWSDFLYVTACDEVWTVAEFDAVNWFYEKYHDYFPGGNCLEAGGGVGDYGATFTDVTAYCPLVKQYYDTPNFYHDKMSSGLELWGYVCDRGLGSYMNRFISQHLEKTKLLFWDYWKVGMTGTLHAGWNRWYQYGTTVSTMQRGLHPAVFTGDQRRTQKRRCRVFCPPLLSGWQRH